MEIKNEDYNFLLKRLKRLEEVYKESSDHNIRNVIKERTYSELCELFPEFDSMFCSHFDNCKMESLAQISTLTEYVISNYSAKILPPLEPKKAQKILKLKDKELSEFLREYNKSIRTQPLTYYSQQINQKLIIICEIDNDIKGIVAEVSPKRIRGESLCHFCGQFIPSDDIIFTIKTTKTAKGEYNSIGQYCCKDYLRCNRKIEDRTNIAEFVGQTILQKSKK